MRNFVFKTMNPEATLRPELKEKIQNWILSFYHLDPRYKILTFFNLVAAEGADNVTDDQIDEQNSYAIVGSNGSISNSATAFMVADDSRGNGRDPSSAANSTS